MYNCSKPAKPFQAKLKINHSPSRVHQEHLGYYPTAEEAALAVARRRQMEVCGGVKRYRDPDE